MMVVVIQRIGRYLLWLHYIVELVYTVPVNEGTVDRLVRYHTFAYRMSIDRSQRYHTFAYRGVTGKCDNPEEGA